LFDQNKTKKAIQKKMNPFLVCLIIVFVVIVSFVLAMMCIVAWETRPSVGDTGFQGLVIHGVQGSAGFQVLASNGAQGISGVQGTTTVGAQGINNTTDGSQGSPGTVGIQGARGLRGQQGSSSSDVGTQGVVGKSGVQGIRGQTGFQGPIGERGIIPTILSTAYAPGQSLSYGELATSLLQPLPLLKGSDVLPIWQPGATYRVAIAGTMAENTNGTAVYTFMYNGISIGDVNVVLPNAASATYNYNIVFVIIVITSTQTSINMTALGQATTGQGVDFQIMSRSNLNHAALSGSHTFDLLGKFLSSSSGTNSSISIVLIA
jgi:hypothetical protein